MLVKLTVFSALTLLCTHAVKIHDDAQPGADEARLTGLTTSIDCPSSSNSTAKIDAARSQPAERAVADPASHRTSQPVTSGALIDLRSSVQVGAYSTLKQWIFPGLLLTGFIVLVFILAKFSWCETPSHEDGTSSVQTLGDNSENLTMTTTPILGSREARFFEVADSQYVDPECRPFPYSLGPFRLKMTESIKPEDFNVSMSDAPLQKVSTYALAVGKAYYSESVRRAMQTLKQSEHAIHGCVSPVHEVTLDTTAKGELGITDSAKYFSFVHAAVQKPGTGAFFVIPQVVREPTLKQGSMPLDEADDEDDDDNDDGNADADETDETPPPGDGEERDDDEEDEDGDTFEEHVEFDSDLAFVHHGGYVYFDADFNVLCLLALLPDPLGNLRFGPPQKWMPRWTDRLLEADRLQPVTLLALKSCGTRQVCWVMPGEAVERSRQICPQGGFAYLFASGRITTNSSA